jgi:hypothetical protein
MTDVQAWHRWAKEAIAPRGLVVDQVIYLKGMRYEGCHFLGCVLILNKGENVTFQGNTVSDCWLKGDGWPEEFKAKANAQSRTLWTKRPDPRRFPGEYR